MALFQLDQVFGYQDANDIKKLWANDSAPTEPETGEVWLDTSTTPLKLKRYNGTGWDIIMEPTSPFEIISPTDAVFFATRTGGAKAVLSSTENYVFIGSKTNNDVRIVRNDTPKMVFTDAGIGIGTTTPAYFFHIQTTGENAGLYIQRTDGVLFKLNCTDSIAQIGTITNHQLNFVTGNTSRLTIDVDGQVFIGGNIVYHAGNDGSGSGLDADKLDGQEGSYYRDASNLNAGNVNRARLGLLSNFINPYIQAQTVTASNEQTITFPAAFTQVPVVVCSGYHPGSEVLTAPHNISTTGFVAKITDSSESPLSNVTLSYIAIGQKN